MERLTNDLFKPLTQTESKRLVGGLPPEQTGKLTSPCVAGDGLIACVDDGRD